MRGTWLSKAGLVLCGIYLAIAAPLLLLSYISTDAKAEFVFGQLACLPAVLLLTWTGAIDSMMRYPWLNNYPAAIVLSLVICYVIGVGLALLYRALFASLTSGLRDK